MEDHYDFDEEGLEFDGEEDINFSAEDLERLGINLEEGEGLELEEIQSVVDDFDSNQRLEIAAEDTEKAANKDDKDDKDTNATKILPVVYTSSSTTSTSSSSTASSLTGATQKTM
eukprot:Awhi_evm1s1517